jgi:hypothetical protein
MHPLISQEIARAAVAAREAEADRHRLASRLSGTGRVRRIVGRAFVATGQRLLGA